MKLSFKALYVLISCLVPASATPSDRLLLGWEGDASAPPIIDLGYARYQGYYDSTFGLHVWKG